MSEAPTASPAAQAAPLTEEDATGHLLAGAFRTGPPGGVGVELEWLVRPAHDPLTRVDPARITALLGETGSAPRHGRVTFEPGGAFELSSDPARGLAECVRRTDADLARIRAALSALGVRLLGAGLDPDRPPERLASSERYAAMERYFDREGTAGRWMMANTASVQVCLDGGEAGAGPLGYAARWRLVHMLGPVLVAAFANSPMRLSRPSGWKSTRQAVWSRLDPGRTGPVVAGVPGDGDPAEAWAGYALDANVMMIRGERTPWLVPERYTFRDWIRRGFPRPPTMDDLEYHLSTLFPPIRPRGYLELRMIDAQDGDGWIAPLAVTTALCDDAYAADAAVAALEPLWAKDRGESPWRRAARHGLADADLAKAALECCTLAYEALDRLGGGRAARDAVGAFIGGYAARGRCPADDVLDAYVSPGSH